MQYAIISLDLGGTKCAGAIVTESGNMHLYSRKSISGLKGTVVEKRLLEIIEYLKDQCPPDIYLKGIGISVPGIANQNEGTVWAPNIPGWNNYPLRDSILTRIHDFSDVYFDSDRACFIAGECWQGVAAGKKNVIYMAIGTGIGAGILVDGRILRGAGNIAGAIGWQSLDDKFPEGYREFGCFEYNASGEGLKRLASDLKSELDIETSLKPEIMDTMDLFKAFEDQDQLAKATIDKAIDYWAKSLANLVSIFNPEMIILGGGVFGPAIQFIDEIYKRSKQWAQPVAIKNVKYTSSGLGSKAPLLGVAKLTLDSYQ